MKTFALILLLIFSHLASAQTMIPNRYPIFGVYRGLSNPNQSCTLAILEQRAANVAAVLIDQNPYIFVSLPQFTDLIFNAASRASRMTFQSTETNRPGHVEFTLDSTGKLQEAYLTINGATFKCSKVFQIRKQD